jgi:hypothetical protein
VAARRLDRGAEPLDELGRDLVAPALGSKDVFQPLLELGVPGTGIAAAEMALDLDAQRFHELPVQVELDPLEHVFAVSL